MNGILVKSNDKRFTEFINCNLPKKLVKFTLIFFREHELPLNCTSRTSKGGLQSPEFYSCIQFEIRKRLAC